MKLILGCGGQAAEGWLGIDKAGIADLLLDLRDGLPFEDASVECAVAHHFLCQLTPSEISELLTECHRILEPGGVLRISLADIPAAIHAADHGNDEWFAMCPDGTIAEQLAWFVYGNQRHSILTRAVIGRLLVEAGFRVYRHAEFSTACDDETIRQFDSRFDESFYIEGIR